MSVASSYAKALYEAAKENSMSAAQMDEMESQMDFLQSVLETKDAKTALLGPITTDKEKADVLGEISQKFKFSALLTQFFVLLAKKDRLTLLSSIRDTFSTFRLTLEGGLAGRLVAAENVGREDCEYLAKAFSKKLEKKVTFRVSTDPSLLAGIKVTVSGVTYDGTLRSQLQKLHDSFVAGLPGART